jgi:transposase
VLVPHAHKVVVCDPKRNLWIHKDAVKDDKIDARKLAEIARLGGYKEVYHTADESIYHLHLAVKDYDRLVKRTTGLKNQIKARLRAEGIICEGAKVFGKKGRQQALCLVASPLLREMIASDYEMLDFLLRKQAQAKGRFVRLGSEIPIVRALQDIPGVGPVGAARFCAYVKCPHRFSGKGKLYRYSRLGITKHNTGGQEIRHQHLDRAGNGTLKDVSRKAFQAALRMRGDNLIKRAYRSALESTGSQVHARLTTQRKILAIMWAMWRCGTPYDDDYDRKKVACKARL